MGSMFYGCKSFNQYGYKDIKQINFNSNTTEIGQNGFIGNPIKNLNLPSTITKIDQHAFGNCKNLEKITFTEPEPEAPEPEAPAPAALELGMGAFAGCDSLNTIVIEYTLEITHLSFADKKNMAAFSSDSFYTDADPPVIKVNIVKAFSGETASYQVDTINFNFGPKERAEDYVKKCALFYEFKHCDVYFTVEAQQAESGDVAKSIYKMTKNKRNPNFSSPEETSLKVEELNRLFTGGGKVGGGRIHRNIKSNSIKSKISKKKKYKAKITQKNRITP